MVDVLSDLNDQQRRAVTHTGAPLLIVAGAGTGKTTVITRRIVWLLTQPTTDNQQLTADNVLALTFTDKAAQEMEDRVAQLLPLGAGDLWISTFHAFGERILRNHAADAGLADDFRLLTPTESWWIMKKHADRFLLDYYRPRGNPTKFFRTLLQHFSRLKDEGIGVAEYRAYADDRRLNQDATIAAADDARTLEIAEAYRIYQEILTEENALDFGDLLLGVRDLFRERPAVLQRHQKQFRALVVDEFQDTNAVQYELVKLLAAATDSDEFLGRSLAVVADDDQAIYRWRGASFNNVIQFGKDFSHASVVVLTKNYRSCQNILDCAYKFIQHNNPYRLEAVMNDGGAGLLGQIVKSLTAAHGRSGLIEHLHATTEEAEARTVVERIYALKQGDASLSWSDIAILLRANSDADAFLPALLAAEVPYRHFAARGLYKKPFILDLTSALRVIDNAFASSSLWRVLTSPLLSLEQRDRSRVIERMRERGDVALIDLLRKASADEAFSTPGRGEIAKLLGWIETLARDARDHDVGVVLLRFLEVTGLLMTLGRAQNQQTLANLADLQQFYQVIDRFTAATDESTVHAFLEYLDLALASGDEGTSRLNPLDGPDAVQVLTVHSAKGLEFRYVFLVHLVDRRFPTSERMDALEFPPELLRSVDPSTNSVAGQSEIRDHGSIENNPHLMEERRLFYVGMTRARDGLFFTSAEDYGGARKKKLSRFLFEAGIAHPETPPKPTGKTRFENAESRMLKAESDQLLQATSYKLQAQETFSYTQIKTYETCPLQYKFAHVLKLPRRGSWTLSFGQTMHATLEKFFSLASGGEQESLFHINTHKAIVRVPPLSVLLEIYEQSWVPQWYASAVQAQDYRTRGKAMLVALYERYEQSGWPIIWALEKPFFVTVGDIRLKGTIDRIDRVKAQEQLNAVAIVDYKTGKSPKDDQRIDRDQLLLYQSAVSKVFGQQPVELRYEFLEDQKVVAFLGTAEELILLEQRIAEVIGNIRSEKFEPTPAINVCGFCDFKEICEYRAL